MDKFSNTGDIVLDEKCKTFINNPSADSAFDILICCRCSNKINYSIAFGEYFLTLFPYNNYNILNEVANAYFQNRDYQKASTIYTFLLNKPLSQEFTSMILYNLGFSLEKLRGSYSNYPKGMVLDINPLPYITLSITTCKRLDLFERTMNSFLNCVLDKHLISEYICVDDNSSEEDRNIMKEKYPFFKFYFKSESEKGHPRSMNIIKNLCKTKYLFHIEDDWEFVYKDNYISKCIHILNSDKSIKQCLLNKNYGELVGCLNTTIGGQYMVTEKSKEGPGGIRYYIHEQMTPQDYVSKYGSHRNCAYWPHFSFRPSVIDASIFGSIGDFNESCNHFEMEYANRYISKGYKSAFLEGIYCIHIGRLTSDRSGIINAYNLNGQKQFADENTNIKIPYKCRVINLDRRQDRMNKFSETITKHNLEYKRFSAIDGIKLTSTRQLRRIFDPNNYRWSRGVIGCALSHLSLWIDLVNSDEQGMIILEDDVQFANHFKTKLGIVCKECANIDWDVVYIGTFPRNNTSDDQYDQYVTPKLLKKGAEESVRYTYGGTIGYMISKKGATKLLQYIDKHGMVCAIDTMMLLAANDANIYFVEPQLVKSQCFCTDPSADTDIQKGYNDSSTHMTVDIHKRIQDEMNVFGRVKLVNDTSQLDSSVVNIKWPGGNGDDDVDVCGYKWYPIGDCKLYVSEDYYKKCEEKFLFSRLKHNGQYSVQNAIAFS